jgi:hypothetical protein
LSARADAPESVQPCPRRHVECSHSRRRNRQAAVSGQSPCTTRPRPPRASPMDASTKELGITHATPVRDKNVIPRAPLVLLFSLNSCLQISLDSCLLQRPHTMSTRTRTMSSHSHMPPTPAPSTDITGKNGANAPHLEAGFTLPPARPRQLPTRPIARRRPPRPWPHRNLATAASVPVPLHSRPSSQKMTIRCRRHPPARVKSSR